MVVLIILNVNLQGPLSKAKAAAQYNLAEPKLLGQNDFGKDIYLKNGRFGPYLQYEKEIEKIKKLSQRKEKRRKLKKMIN